MKPFHVEKIEVGAFNVFRNWADGPGFGRRLAAQENMARADIANVVINTKGSCTYSSSLGLFPPIYMPAGMTNQSFPDMVVGDERIIGDVTEDFEFFCFQRKDKGRFTAAKLEHGQLGVLVVPVGSVALVMGETSQGSGPLLVYAETLPASVSFISAGWSFVCTPL